MRRVITGVDAAGRSYFASVDEVKPAFAELWASAPGDPLTAAPPAAGAGPAPIEPPMGATTWRIFELPDDAVVAEYLRSQGLPGHDGSAFHRTHTLDYILILDGELTLEVDTGSLAVRSGDCVVQRGTNHAWRNKSGRPVRMAAVMIALPGPR